MLARQVVLCWLDLHDLEIRYQEARARGETYAEGTYLERLRNGAQLAHELCCLNISMDCLASLGSTRAWIYNKCSIHATRNLNHVVIVAVIPVRANILLMHSEIVGVGLSRHDWLHTNAWNSIRPSRNHQSMPVESSSFREMVDQGDAQVVGGGDMNHRTGYCTIDGPGEYPLHAFYRFPHDLLGRQGKVFGPVGIHHVFRQLSAI